VRNFELFTYAYLPKNGDVVIDVGSGIGDEIEEFCKLVGKGGHVYAIEADPDIAKDFRRKIQNLGLENVSCHNVAIWKEKALLSLQVFSESGISHVDYIKINIEGAERELLMGCVRTRPFIRNWCISTHDFCGIPTRDYVVKYLVENDFDFFFQENDWQRPWVGGYVYAIHGKGGRK
jgi:hypothetical protein